MTAWQTLREAPRRLGEVAASARPNLRGIDSPPRRMARVPFAALMATLLVAGMVGVLVLNTALQSQAFALREAKQAANELGYKVSDLEAQVNRAKSPVMLGRRATQLGMVPNPYGVFIDLATGRIDGVPVPARGNEIPSLRVLQPAPVVAPTAIPASGTVPATQQTPAAPPPAEQPPAAQPPMEQPTAAQALAPGGGQ